MKQLLFILCLFLGFYGSVKGKGINTTARISGTILKNDKQLDVELKIPLGFSESINFEKLQKKIIYYFKGKKHKVRPEEIEEVRFEYKGQKYRLVSLNVKITTFTTFKRRLLLRLHKDGSIRLFTILYKDRVGSGSFSTSNYWVINKEGIEAEVIYGPSRERILKELKEDCMKIGGQDTSTKIIVNDIEDLVDFYNKESTK